MLRLNNIQVIYSDVILVLKGLSLEVPDGQIVALLGANGAGKTTTLYTMLDILNTPEVNISTVEDPIEYQMVRVNQTQVKPEIGFTFGNGCSGGRTEVGLFGVDRRSRAKTPMEL